MQDARVVCKSISQLQGKKGSMGQEVVGAFEQKGSNEKGVRHL
jgi:hypothetical protein